MKPALLAACCLLALTPPAASAPGDLIWSGTASDTTDYGSPAVSGGRVFFGLTDGNLLCLSSTTGNFLWSYDTGWDVCVSPAVVGDLVYGGGVYIPCLNVSDGSKVWETSTDFGSISAPAVVDGWVYMGESYSYVMRLNAATGASGTWYYSMTAVTTAAVVSDNRVYAAGYAYMQCWDIGGTQEWNFMAGGPIRSSPAICAGRIYFGSDDDTFYCRDATDGSPIWTCLTGGDIKSSPAISGGRVYFGSDDGKLYCLSAETGMLHWSYETGGAVRSSPAVSGSWVYVGSDDGYVYCLNATTGALVWSYDTGAAVRSSPAVAAGAVYVGAGTGVFCIEAAAGDPGEWPKFRGNLANTGAHTGAVHLSVPLNQGWNLTGPGRAEPIALVDCLLSDGADTYGYDDAVAAGWAQGVLFYYDAGYHECRFDGGGEDDHLRHQYGYWLLTYRPGLTLLIPRY